MVFFTYSVSVQFSTDLSGPGHFALPTVKLLFSCPWPSGWERSFGLESNWRCNFPLLVCLFWLQLISLDLIPMSSLWQGCHVVRLVVPDLLVRRDFYTPAQRSWRGSILDSLCPSVRPSVCRRHGFRSISQVCFGIFYLGSHLKWSSLPVCLYRFQLTFLNLVNLPSCCQVSI